MAEPADRTETSLLRMLGSTATLRACLLTLVKAMPREEQTVLALAVVSGLSYRDIATHLEIDESAVKDLLRHALSSMRHQLVAQLAVLGGPQRPRFPVGPGDSGVERPVREAIGRDSSDGKDEVGFGRTGS